MKTIKFLQKLSLKKTWGWPEPSQIIQTMAVSILISKFKVNKRNASPPLTYLGMLSGLQAWWEPTMAHQWNGQISSQAKSAGKLTCSC